MLLVVIADPGLSVEIAREVAPDLPGRLSDEVSGDRQWDVQVACHRLPMDEQAGVRLSPTWIRHVTRQDADVVIALTDQPRRADTDVVVADANRAGGVALISLPGLGAVQLARRVARMVVQVTGELICRDARSTLSGSVHDGRLDSQGLVRRQATAGEDDEAVRFLGVGPRARLRLLAGMVRANRPWRLIPQLSGAFAGALATDAYVVVNASIWRLADTAGLLRLSVTTLLAVSAMVVWLIVKHRLWERPSDRGARKRATVYNVTTAITLMCGVLCLYVALFVMSLVAEAVLLRGPVVQESIRHSVVWSDYARIAWLASSMATMGGAIGSGLDSDAAAREAAYGYRQNERRVDQDRARSSKGPRD